MKKLAIIVIFALFLCIFSVTQAMAINTFKISYDLNGSYHVDDNKSSNSQDVKSCSSIGYEYTLTNGANEYGIGLEYQLAREIENKNGAKFYSIPIYGVMTHYFGDNQIIPFITGRLGYNVMSGNSQFKNGGDVDGGYYFGIGGGISYANYIAELIYSGSHCKPSNSKEMEYNEYAVTFGYKF